MKKEMEKYYEENGKKVYLYLMTLCSDSDKAEELTQETFYQAIRSLKNFKGQSSVYTWLCGIARNLWLNDKRRSGKYTSAELSAELEDDSPPPDKIAEDKEQQMLMLRQLHSLPENEKEIILLRASAGLSFKDIGEIFGKSENWARVSYYRARKKLNGLL